MLLLAYPFSGRLMSALVLLTSAPYFMVMASDLKRCGYKHTDVLRIYGFNLIMLPVNAFGVLQLHRPDRHRPQGGLRPDPEGPPPVGGPGHASCSSPT